jgi:signal transduction histidine kinase/ActR/RegA family two-component response regulator
LLNPLKKAVVGPSQKPLSSDELEHGVQRRMFNMLAGFIGVIASAYCLVYTIRGQHHLAAVSGLSAVTTAACLLAAWRSGQFAWPMRVLVTLVFAAMSLLTLEQGRDMPATGWWLSIVPFLLAGSGLYRMAIVAVFAFIGIVTWMHFGSSATPVAVEPWRRYVSVIGSETLALLVISVGMRTRARVAQALDTARAAAQDAAATKASFLAHMSHEIRTPLTGIIGAAEVLASNDLSEAQRAQLLSLQRQSAGTLLALVNDVLDFAKLEAGQMPLEVQPLRLRDLVFESNELFAMQAFAKNIDLTSSCSPDVLPAFFADPLRLRQIVNNLVGNAVKFTERGEVHVHLSMEALPETAGGRRWVRISVNDTGPGIPLEQVPRLFDPFTQAEDSARRRNGGSGLGLSISQDLARLMGGRIEVDSRVGHGSTFALVVPLLSEVRDTTPAIPKMRPDVVLATTSPGLTRHIISLLTQLDVAPRVLSHLPSADEMSSCRALLVDAPLLPRTGALAWLTEQERTGRHVAVMTPLGADAVVGAPEGVHLIYKPVRLEALGAVLLSGRKEETSPAHAEPLPPPPPLTALRVLVAEDNPVNQVVIQAMLSELGVTSTVTDNGRDALAEALSSSYDLVLMDVHMPEMDGLHATWELRAQERQRGTRPVSVVAMTARTEHDDEAACFAAGMDSFLPKPFGLGQLRRCLEQIAARQAAR